MTATRFQSRWFSSVFMAACALLTSEAMAQSQSDPPGITLSGALETAFQRNPVLKMQQAEVAEAQGRLKGATAPAFNPVIDAEAGSRHDPAGNKSADFSIGVSQEIGITGQRGHRTDAALAELQAARAQMLHNKRILAAQVDLAFFDALRTRDLLDISRQDAELARTLLETAQRRKQAGDATQLEVNLSIAELGRAEERMNLARADYQEARAVLAELTGLDPASPPVPLGDLAGTLEPIPALPELIRTAMTNRADLEALRLMETAAQARQKLARSEAIPNLSVGGFYAQEGGSEVITGGNISFDLPLFNRNQGEIAEARATSQRVAAEREAALLQVQREVAATHARYEAASESVTRLQQTVLGTLEENLTLLQKAFDAGKTSWTEVVVIRRSFIDARREYVEAAMMARRDRVLLDLAAGQLTIPETKKVDQRP